VVVQHRLPRRHPGDRRERGHPKIEEAVNTVAGINQLYSRSYEGSSVVIIEFNLDVDGRRAADDVREKLALMRPLLRDEVKDSRVCSASTPPGRPIYIAGAHLARRLAHAVQS
jgi:hydrophobic/amphiphilic exporter-1 (mainly G- bacteria), HAE1 family